MGEGISTVEKYLSVWVAASMIAGTALGYFGESVARVLAGMSVSRVNIPIAVLIWLMIYPMMVKVDFGALRRVRRDFFKGLTVTWVVNWVIKPFTMYLISYFFFMKVFGEWLGLIPAGLGTQYLAGAVLLGAAPCTAMVFVWSYLADGEPLYTLVQVATNDIIILFAYVPIVAFLLGVSNVPVPYDTLFMSVVLFVVIPLTAGYASRKLFLRVRGREWFENTLIPILNKVTLTALLSTLILIFMYQGRIIVENPLHILLIAIPLTIQTYLIFTVAYTWARAWSIRHEVAAPASFVGASNFFELAVAVAIVLFGLESGAILTTVVGVLEEVPIMLSLVAIAKRTKHWFTKELLAKELEEGAVRPV